MTHAASLKSAYHDCAVLTRQRARNFYFGLRLTPEPKRSALYAVYAWMRRADDIVDQPGSSTDADAQLQQFRERTIALFDADAPITDPSGADPHASLWLAFADTVKRYPVRLNDLLAMIEGQHADRTTKRYPTFSQLEHYCYNVASTVGFVCMAVWGYTATEQHTRNLARDHGIGFQLTNIIRDFCEDLERDRIYLPTEDFDRFKILPQVLTSWSHPSACSDFVEFQVQRARQYYESSAQLDQIVHEDGRAAYVAMTRIYRDLLERIAANPRDCFTGKRRAAVPTYRKLSHALHARLIPTANR